ncbi:hypothetical protein [Paracoccus sp. TOH]|uniref:hypothetical protein n=1 Tax=Paracoccus sp. TOH TaxID=1263728 RepID=UPI0025B1AAD6|nr:hypothetical protein [Paracoccus sp. TOH]WJS87277.1 hypothetical protein NBE95_20575 [Paracoccus sp. TOH]
MSFTADEIDHCKAAMSKPAPLEALKLIASGRAIVELTPDRRDLYIDSLDGRPVRDPEFPDRKMLLSGAWPLYRAGMIDEFGLVTPAGRAALVPTKPGDPQCPG